MYELSLFVLDLAQNALTARATLVTIRLVESRSRNRLAIIVADNGCGMTADISARASSPFMTTKTSRRKPVGLGLPLFKQLVESCAGTFRIRSQPGRGTVVAGSYPLDHLDQPPMGDLVGTLFALVAGNPAVDFVVTRRTDEGSRVFDSRLARRELGPDAQALWQTQPVQDWFEREIEELK